MNAALHQLVEDVVGEAEAAAETDPAAAASSYVNAADQFRSFARRREFARVAAELAARANEFEARALHLHHVQYRATKDDFSEIEQDHGQAHAEVGHLDDLEIKARRNEIVQERKLDEGQVNVSILPSSVTQDTPLGRQGQFKFNPTVDDAKNQIKASDTVVLWQGKKSESQAFTIDVGVPTVPQIGTTVSCRPYGIITYGADGFQMSFTFDVGLGVRLTGVGNYCSVLVGMGAPRTGAVSGVMSIGASLGFFAAQSVVPVTLTSYVDSLAAAAASAVIVRPSRAQFILPPQSTDTAGQTRLDFVAYNGVIVQRLLFGDGLVVAPIPVSPQVAGVIVNNTGLVTKDLTLPWQLST